MNPIRHISYERGNAGYQIRVYGPSDTYPAYQITCNDPDSGYGEGTIVRMRPEDVESVLASILSRADDWTEVTQ